MLYPALRFLALAFCAGGVLLAPATTACADTIIIRFDQLEHYATGDTPRARVLQHELVKVEASRDRDLQWSNPAIAYDHEEFDQYREYQVTVQKRFTAPWIYGRKRNAWSARVEAATLQTDQRTDDLLADLKSGYVRMKLMSNHLARLERLEAIVIKAREVAGARHAEGELSALERRLVDLSALSVDASHRNALRQRREYEIRWRTDMGIAPGDSITLASDVAFVPVSLAPVEEYRGRVAERPAARSRAALARALEKEAQAAGPTLFPHLDLYAGYKHLDPDDPGMVAGVSMPLPIFNWNAAAARRIEADQRIVEAELAMHLSRADAEVDALVRIIEELKPTVDAFRANLDEESTTSLLYSWEEGWLTLEGFLGGIRVEVDGLDDYYQQLTMYYDSIFRLEAITGATLIAFDTPER